MSINTPPISASWIGHAVNGGQSRLLLLLLLLTRSSRRSSAEQPVASRSCCCCCCLARQGSSNTFSCTGREDCTSKPSSCHDVHKSPVSHSLSLRIDAADEAAQSGARQNEKCSRIGATLKHVCCTSRPIHPHTKPPKCRFGKKLAFHFSPIITTSFHFDTRHGDNERSLRRRAG